MKKFFLLFLFISASSFAYSPELLLSRFASWGVDPDKHLASINLHRSWSLFKLNRPVVVAVIDTGVDATHPFLKDNLVVVEGNKSEQNFGVDFSESKNKLTPADVHGHGTHIAGIIKSVFPDVKLLALKYTNPKASSDDHLKATIKAFKYAIDKKVDIINFSGGGPGFSQEEYEVMKKAQKAGILVIAAAGNFASNVDEARHAFYPASYHLSNIISVSGYDNNLNLVPSANYGKKTVHIVAPGDRIRSASFKGGAAYMTGTSQATAFVTGVAAMIKSEYPNLKDHEIKKILMDSSMKIKSLEDKVSAGKLDAAGALELADKIQNTKSRSVAGKP